MRFSRLLSFDWLRSPAARTLAWERHFHAARIAHEGARWAEAESAYSAALREAEGFPPADPRHLATLSSLAGLLRFQGRDAEAEPLCLRALRLKEARYGPVHPDVAASLKDLVDVYRAQGKTADAQACYARAVAILEKAIGPDLPELVESLEKAGIERARADPPGPHGVGADENTDESSR